MKKTALSLLAFCAFATSGFAGGWANYNPYQGGFGGYRFSDGTTANYNPYLGGFGGYRFSNGSTATYQPFQGGFGGYQFQDGFGQ